MTRTLYAFFLIVSAWPCFSQEDEAVRGPDPHKPFAESTVGRRVRVWQSKDAFFLGNIQRIEGGQILLDNVFGLGFGDPPGTIEAVLVDTSSGHFNRIEFLRRADDVEIKRVAGRLEKLFADEKDASHEEADRLIDDAFEAQADAFSSDDLPYSNRLNDLEKALMKQNPLKGLSALKCAYEARDITGAMYQNTASCLHNGNGDAFRHALWNSFMRAAIGEEWAKKWGDAHENGDPGNPALEKQMDLFNNDVGRRVNVPKSKAPAKVQEMVRAGTMRRIVSATLVGTDATCQK